MKNHNFSLKQRAASAVAMVMLVSSVLAQSSSPCSDITYNSRPNIPPNTHVPVILASPEPADASGIVASGLQLISGQINGITFSVSSSIPASGPYILVDFPSDTTGPSGRYSPLQDSAGNLTVGRVHIYTNVRGCAGGSTLCFDPSNKSAYLEALKSTVVHEFLHSLHASDSNMQNVMGPFTGVNNTGNANMNLDCVLPRLRAISSSSGPGSGGGGGC